MAFRAERESPAPQGPAGPPGPPGASAGESRIDIVSYGVTSMIGGCGDPGTYQPMNCYANDDSGYFPVTMAPARYPDGTTYQIEVTIEQHGTPGCLRLYDVDAHAPIDGTEVCSTHDGYNHLRSPAFALTGTSRTVGLEVRYASTEPTCDFSAQPCVQAPALQMAAVVATTK